MAATRLPSSASSSGGGQGQQSHWRQNTDDIYGFRSNNQQGMLKLLAIAKLLYNYKRTLTSMFTSKSLSKDTLYTSKQMKMFFIYLFIDNTDNFTVCKFATL